MRGRKPLPPALKLVKGTYRAGREPEQREVGLVPARLSPPSWLSPPEAEVFEEVAGELYRLGVSTRLDAELVAMYAAAVIRYRNAHDLLRRMAAKDPGTLGILVQSSAGGVKRNPVMSVVRLEAAEVTRLGSELGLSPIARIRLGVATKTDPAGGASSYFT